MNSKKLALILACAAMAGTSACNEVGHFCEGGNRCDNNVITICENNEVKEIIDCAAQNLTCDTSSWTCVGGADACTGVDCHGGTCSNGTCDCSSLDSKFTYDATCNKTGCTNSNYTLANNCVDPGDPCATVNCNGGTCSNGTCNCSSLDSKFTYDATCNKTGCTDNTLSFVGGDCVATTDVFCTADKCNGGTCDEDTDTCDCSDLDDKFTYDATCTKTGCADSTLSLDDNCEAVTDLCEGVVCKNETTCDETTGKCDCSGLEGYGDTKFDFSDTCEKSCANGMSLDNDCAECSADETQCVIEVVDGDDGKHNVAKYLLQSCEEGAWSAGEECADGGICAADGKGCINPADLEEELCPADGYYTCNTTFYSGTPLYVVCYGGEVIPTACVGDTPTCSVAAQNCVEAIDCSTVGENRVDDGTGNCVCDAANGYVEVEDEYSGTTSCVKSCEDGEVRCVTDEFGSLLETCYENFWEQSGTCADGCNATNTGCADGGDTPTDGGLFISEYVYGSANQRAIELYNAGSESYDLSNCKIQMKGYTNKGAESNAEYVLSDKAPEITNLAAGQTIVFCSSALNTALTDSNPCTTSDMDLGYNGDDAILLVCDDAILDVVGQVGDDVGTYWGTESLNTQMTLVRKCGITKGDTNAEDDFDPSAEWIGFAKDTFSNLGTHEVTCSTECVADTKECDATKGARVCGPDGTWGDYTACTDGCDGDVCKVVVTPECAADAKKCVDGEGAYVCGADGTWGTPTPCTDGCDGDVCKEGDTPTTCNEAGGAIYSDYDEKCICDGTSNYYGDPDTETGACKKCPEDGYPLWGSTPGCGCDGGKTWNSETNTCEAVTVFCTEGKCNGGTCDEETDTCTCTGIDGYDATKFVYSALCEKTGCVDSSLLLENDCEAVTVFCTEGKCNGGTCNEETDTCDCSGLDAKFTYDDVCEKTGCANSEYTLANNCEAVTLVTCDVFGGGTVNVDDLGCKDANTLAICIAENNWDTGSAQECAFGCAANECVSKSADADENGGICTDDTHFAQLTADGTAYQTDPAQCAADEPWCGTFAEMTGCWECVKDEHCAAGESCVDGACEAPVAPTCGTFADCEGDFNACIEGSCKKLECRSIDDVGSFKEGFNSYDPWCEGAKVTYCEAYKVTADEDFASCRELTGDDNNVANCSGTDELFIQGSTKSACVTMTDAPSGTLFISEYLHGASNKRAIELYNASSETIDLANCKLQYYTNGKTTSADQALSGELAAGQVYVTCSNVVTDDDTTKCNDKSLTNTYNGNDAIELVCGTDTLDVIGKIGEDPGTAWSNNGVSTKSSDLVRKCGIISGDTDGTDDFDPSVEWDSNANTTFTNLGSHKAACD